MLRKSSGPDNRFSSSRLARRRVLLALAAGAVMTSLAYNATWRTRSGISPVDVDTLLLSPSDFPNVHLGETQRLGKRETRDGGQAAQVVMKGGRIEVFQSVVALPSEDAAHAAFQATSREATISSGKTADDAPVFGEESVVLRGKQGEKDTITAVFRERSVLMRVTIAGSTDVQLLTTIALKAQDRVKQEFRGR